MIIPRVVEALLSHRRLATSLIVLVTLVAALAGSRVKIDLGFDSLYDKDDPASVDHRRWVERWGDRGQSVFVLLRTRDGDMLSAARLSLVADVERAVTSAQGIARTLSVLSVERVGTGATGIVGVSIVKPDDPGARSRILGDATTRGLLVSDDGRTVTVLAQLTPKAENNVTVDEIERLALEVTAGSGLEVHISGLPVVIRAYTGQLVADQLFFVAGALLIVSLLLLVLMRSVRGVVLPLVASGLGSVWLLGVMGATGASIDLVTNPLPLLILIVGLSDAIHLLVRADEEARVDGARAARRAVVAVGVACLLNSLTTGAGLLTLVLTHTPPVVRFGLYGFVGLLLVFSSDVLIVTLAQTSGIRWFAPRGVRAPDWLDTALGRLAALSQRRPVVVVALAGALLVVAALGLPALTSESRTFEEIPPGDPSFTAARVVDDELSGILFAVIVLDAPDGTFARADALAHVARLGAHLRDEPAVGWTLSVADLVTQAHEVVVPAARGLPEDDALVAQLIFLADGPSLQELLKAGHGSTQLLVRARDVSSREWSRIQRDLERELATLPPDIRWTVTGPTPITFAAVNRVLDDLRNTLGAASVALFLLLLIGMRSLRLALLGMVPNLLPLAVTLGAMGWLGISVRIGTVIILNLSLALAVDNTVHFLHRLREEERGGATPREASVLVVRHAGRAMAVTGLVLAGGFLVLTLSSFGFVRDMGILGALIAATALFGDLLLLPALIRLFSRRPAP